jgi:superfamily II DNA or RNA helicase
MGDCEKYESIVLQKHQLKLVKFITQPSAKGILVFHSVGSGKTITSLAAARCLLEKFPLKFVQVITNASLTGNFLKEISNLKLKFKNKISVDSYASFLVKAKKTELSCRDTVLVVDESQGINGQSSSRFKWIFECAKQAPKVILLSATPVKNYPEEFSNQLSVITGEKISRTKLELISTLNPDSRDKAYSKILGCKVSYVKTSVDDKNYPVVDTKLVNVKMNEEFYNEYLKIQQNESDNGLRDTKNLAVFYNGIRRAVNKSKSVSPKINWVIKKILQDVGENKKVLVYSAWLESGIKIIKKILESKGVFSSEVSGKIAGKDKQRQVKQFNDGKTKVLLISSAGAEGLDLKGTRSVIILEPYWNDSRVQQVIGRAVRYGSHSNLPKSERKVEVFQMVLVKNPKYMKSWDKTDSADSILLRLSLQKQQGIDNFYSSLEKVSIEKNNCME